MSTATMSRDDLWEVTSRTIVYAAIGAALYGILLVAQVPIPGTHRVRAARIRAGAVLRLRVRPDRRVLHRPRRQRDRRPALRLGRADVLELEHRQRPRRPRSPAWRRCTWPRWTNGSLRDRAIGGAVAGVDRGRSSASCSSFTDLIIQAGEVPWAVADVLLHPGRRRRHHRDRHPGADPRVRLGAGEGPAGPLALPAPRGRHEHRPAVSGTGVVARAPRPPCPHPRRRPLSSSRSCRSGTSATC